MKNVIIFLLVTAQAQCLLFSQAPLIEWQNTIGGAEDDELRCIEQTDDGGFILAGYSYSDISGDKSENSLGTDYWIIKLNNSGEIEWQNTIGGMGDDWVESVHQTTDGGYIVGGFSYSGISGDKTEGAYLDPYGEKTADYWVIKLNSFGNIEWQNTIGGNKWDYLNSLEQTSDGGYILGGYSSTGISGDKTENAKGNYDYWVVKLNALGSIVWQNTIGGNNFDGLKSIQQTVDGGYILGGYSLSGISGDKAEGNFGGNDYWVIKLNNSGDIVWQNTIGGNGQDYVYSIDQTFDGGYILGGFSTSDSSGDKMEMNIGDSSYYDLWILKLNPFGNIEWQNSIGGSGIDVIYSVQQTIDGGYILGGTSNSQISGDKTEDHFGLPDHPFDYWIIKLNTDGSIQWQNTIAGNKDEGATSISQTEDNGYLIGGYSSSEIYGDKSEASLIGGAFGYDFWVIKLFPECDILNSENCNSLDDNCNGLIDDGVTETISIAAGGPIIFCQGGSVLLTATYTGASVQWKKNGVNIAGATSSTYSVIKSGDYTCVTTSPCGTATSSLIHVTVNKNPAASITAGGATTFCAGGSVTLTEAAVAGSTYQWYKGASAIAGATSTNYSATTAGNYKCRVTKTASGCFKNSNTITVTVPCKQGSTVDEEPINSRFEIYPNPNNGTFTINALWPLCALCENNKSTIEIYNSLGQLIYSQNICTASCGDSSNGNINETISIFEGSCGDNIPPVIYFVKLNNADNSFSEQKVVIQ
ncbi:MAG: T9SS type A sorting domain-containing protein [Chitinophagales bacterium]